MALFAIFRAFSHFRHFRGGGWKIGAGLPQLGPVTKNPKNGVFRGGHFGGPGGGGGQKSPHNMVIFALQNLLQKLDIPVLGGGGAMLV